jgi:hypothetical protein
MATESKPPSECECDTTGQHECPVHPAVGPQVTHARAIDTAPTGDDGDAPSVDQRIEFICGLMAELQWERGKTAKVLAAKWGLAVSTVEGNAATASRIMTADKTDVARDIGVVARKMLLSASEVFDFKGVKAMGDLLLDVSGARAPTKVESLNVNANVEPTPAEASRLVREAFGEHAARKAIPDAPEPGDLSESAPKE